MLQRVAPLFAATAIAVTGVAVYQVASGQTTATESVFVSIEPCRLIQTRPANNVGPRDTPLPEGQPVSFGAHDGDDAGSDCAIPSTAVAINANATIVQPSASSDLRFYPADQPTPPNVSNLNFRAGQGATPNAATIPLSDDGRFNALNKFGTVHLIIDVNGYYQPSTSVGATGPAGPAGPRNRISDEQVLFEQWEADPARPLVVDVPGNPDDIASDGTHVFATIGASDIVVTIDPATGTLVGSPIPVGDSPEGIVFVNGRLFVGNSNDDTVSVIDAATRTVIDTIALDHGTDHTSTDGQFVYVVGGVDDRMSRIDPTTNEQILPVITTGETPEESVSDGTRIWVTNYDDNSLTSYDPTTGAEVGSAIVLPGAGPAGIAFDGTYLWVGGYDDGSLYRIDPESRTVVGSPFGGFDSPFTLTYDGRRIYVTEDGPQDLSIVDAASGAVIGTVELGTGADSFGAFFDGSNVWVASQDSTVVRLHPSL